MADRYPPVWVKRRHAKGCEGSVVNRQQRINVDRIGRIGNGGIVAHVYTCNRGWAGCKARVYIAEHTIRSIAADAVGEQAAFGRRPNDA